MYIKIASYMWLRETKSLLVKAYRQTFKFERTQSFSIHALIKSSTRVSQEQPDTNFLRSARCLWKSDALKICRQIGQKLQYQYR